MNHGELLHIDEEEGLRLRDQRPDTEVAATAAARFRALGDPTRLTLALALRDGKELCVCDLSWISQRSQNLVSHHMKALRAEGLVRARREGKMVMYSLTSDGEVLLDASRLERASGPSSSR